MAASLTWDSLLDVKAGFLTLEGGYVMRTTMWARLGVLLVGSIAVSIFCSLTRMPICFSTLMSWFRRGFGYESF